MPMCKVEECSNDSEIRGLCKTCYASARNLVRTNKATWKELEELGLCDPPKTRGTSLFSAAFEDSKDLEADHESTRGLGKPSEQG